MKSRLFAKMPNIFSLQRLSCESFLLFFVYCDRENKAALIMSGFPCSLLFLPRLFCFFFFPVHFVASLIKGLTNQAVMDALNLGQGVCEPSSLSCENEDIFVKRGHFSRASLLLQRRRREEGGVRRYGTNNVRAAGVCLCVCVCGQAARCCQPLETMSLTHFEAVNAATQSRREALVPSGSPPS